MRATAPHRTPCRAHAAARAALALGLALGAALAPARSGRTAAEARADVTELALEELLRVEVTSASKKPELLARVPAAIYVIRGEDLQRTGVTTLAEALRMVPGVHVARQFANNWAITARGFNGGNSNKLLVLIDGRTVYSNLHSGVFWDVQDLPLDDIERIEVIRGPGGTLWGTNAVNGVINVISKSARQTPGPLLSAGAGMETRGLLELRHGMQLGESHQLRVSGKLVSLDSAASAVDSRHQSRDGMLMRRGGFRSDWSGADGTQLRVLGELYDGWAQSVSRMAQFSAPFASGGPDHTRLRGGHLLGHWERAFGPGSSLKLQTYYDAVARESELFDDALHTGDFELQRRLSPASGHDLVLGLGYRLYVSDFEGSFSIAMDRERRTDDIWSAFAQDEIELLRERLWLTLGMRLEHGDYSRAELMPSARLSWALAERSHAWLAASRAVRAPSLLDVDSRLNVRVLPGTPPTLQALFGTDHFRPEELTALEAGYRTQPLRWLHLDTALFYSFYENLRSIAPGAAVPQTTPVPHTLAPFFIVNESRARAYGAELATDLQLAPWWLLRLSYSHFYLDIHQPKRLRDLTRRGDLADEDRYPRNQLWLRSALNLPHGFTLDLIGRAIGRLPAVNLDSHLEADLRLGWQPAGSPFSIALVGRNLAHRERPEFSRSQSAIERELFVQLQWRPR